MSIESMMPSNHLIFWSASAFSTSNEYSGLISFRFDGLDLCEVLGILKSLLQHQNSKTSVLQHPEDEMVGWHHGLNGHECEQTLGGSEGQESLVNCSSWAHKELDTT